MMTRPIRPFLLSLALVAAPVGPPAQAQDSVADPPVLPGDLVSLEVWHEEDMTGEFLVDQHFLVTLPLIGELDVRGETELSLREKVRDLMQVELINPSIRVFVLKRVRVLGAVNAPGMFHVGATMSVADALAAAGGWTPSARRGMVILRRGGELIEVDVYLDEQLSALAVRTGDELLVPEKAWLELNLIPIAMGLTTTAGLIFAILAR